MFRPDALAFFIFALKKARASGRNVGKVFNPVLKLVFKNYPFSCLSQLRNPHFTKLYLSSSWNFMMLMIR